MGAKWSTPPGRAEIPSRLLPFTVWGKEDLWMMRRRHTISLGGIFALRKEHFSRLLGVHHGVSDLIFKNIFDTDANGLIDAFETMCAFALLCSASIEDKVDFAHSLFDFRSEGDLNLDEVTILLRTTLLASAKLDNRVQVPQTETLEELCRLAFDQADLHHEGELPKHLFESFIAKDQQVKGVFSPSLPPPGAIRWLRPSEIAKGDQTVLFAGDLPGDGPIVPGQLADQWLLSAMAILTGRPHLLRLLFQHTGQEYAGRYCIRLFKDANWINVFVDSRVPCGADGKVLFCHGQERHEMWAYLVEKAFAKAHGCYENLMHGDTCEALRDLTGGVAEKLQWARFSASSTRTSLELQPRTQPHTTPASGKTVDAKRCLRLTGWGLTAGETRSSGWIFDETKNRISRGQVLGCSLQAWLRDPWEDEDEEGTAPNRDDGVETNRRRKGPFGRNGMLFPPSNRIMQGVSSWVAYCVLEAFEIDKVRLVRLKDPWSGRFFGAQPGQYLGDWGPNSPLWSARPALASELLPRTLPGMFWMAFDTFVEVFNTLYDVDLAGDIEGQTTGGMINNKRQEKKLAYERAQKSSASSFREGRCEGRWEGHRCGGRFTDGKGWLAGTQVFLQIEPCAPKRSESAMTTPSAVKAMNADGKANIYITLTQEDSRYHGKDYSTRDERRRSIGFLVHSHKWSAESERGIPKLSKIVQKETKYVTCPFVPRRDISAHLALPPGQYAILPTTLVSGTTGRFWVHVKSADPNSVLLKASAPNSAVIGPNPGECEMPLRETGASLGVVYNEAEEDAEGNVRNVDVVNVLGLCAQMARVASQQS